MHQAHLLVRLITFKGEKRRGKLNKNKDKKKKFWINKFLILQPPQSLSDPIQINPPKALAPAPSPPGHTLPWDIPHHQRNLPLLLHALLLVGGIVPVHPLPSPTVRRVRPRP